MTTKSMTRKIRSIHSHPFHSVKMFRTLKELGTSWLMLAKKTKRVSDAMAEMVESAEGREPMSRMIVVRGQDGEEEH